jgi:hypothetical protein
MCGVVCVLFGLVNKYYRYRYNKKLLDTQIIQILAKQKKNPGTIGSLSTTSSLGEEKESMGSGQPG